MARLFGTDGVRGIANVELTPELAFKLGYAAATYFGREVANPKIIIGRDTRVLCWKAHWLPVFALLAVMRICWV